VTIAISNELGPCPDARDKYCAAIVPGIRPPVQSALHRRASWTSS
jgi:hypothetical protein